MKNARRILLSASILAAALLIHGEFGLGGLFLRGDGGYNNNNDNDNDGVHPIVDERIGTVARNLQSPMEREEEQVVGPITRNQAAVQARVDRRQKKLQRERAGGGGGGGALFSNLLRFTDPKSTAPRSNIGALQQPVGTISQNDNRPKTSGGGNGYFGSSRVIVLQAADTQYASVMQPLMDDNAEWARCNGYHYVARTWERTAHSGCVYTQKVRAIYETLMDADEGDWIIFLDADLKFQIEYQQCGALEDLIPKVSQNDSRGCEMIAMISGHSVNSGIMLLRKTPVMARVAGRWLEIQSARDERLCRGPADQLALQEAILEHHLGTNYSVDLGRGNFAKCIDLVDGSLGHADACFGRALPETMRNYREFCLIDCLEYPLQCRGQCLRDRTCSRGDVIFDHGVFNHNQDVKKMARGDVNRLTHQDSLG